MPSRSRRMAECGGGLAAAIVVLVIASKLIGASRVGAIFLDVAELAAVALVWSHGTPEAAAAGRKYLYSIIPAIACTLIAGSLVGTGAEPPGPALQKLVVCLVIVGFALKLGLIPFYFWLPAVASAAAPMTTALIVSIVDIATFGELAALREASPWIFGEYAPVWMVDRPAIDVRRCAACPCPDRAQADAGLLDHR